jgi:hypothetical protein
MYRSFLTVHWRTVLDGASGAGITVQRVSTGDIDGDGLTTFTFGLPDFPIVSFMRRWHSKNTDSAG